MARRVKKKSADIDFKKLSVEAIENIREDREEAKELLNDLMKWMNQSPERHALVAQTLSKYLETLQRSNEQLVKVAALAQKNEGPQSQNLSEADAKGVFEALKNKDN